MSRIGSLDLRNPAIIEREREEARYGALWDWPRPPACSFPDKPRAVRHIEVRIIADTAAVERQLRRLSATFAVHPRFGYIITEGELDAMRCYSGQFGRRRVDWVGHMIGAGAALAIFVCGYVLYLAWSPWV